MREPSDLSLAAVRSVTKPWGSNSLAPWSRRDVGGKLIGELWFESQTDPASSSLLLKLLFTEQHLSVQVHPDNAYAQSMGLPNGKNEAWYILSARPGAQVAIGLKRRLNADELRAAILDASIIEHVAWHDVAVGDVFFVPAGTVHAIGSGLVIAEIQQRSDTTFRMHDFGRGRSLDVENAVAVADMGPLRTFIVPQAQSQMRAVLVDSPALVMERVELNPAERMQLRADGETWVIVIRGSLRLAALDLAVGEVAHMSVGRVELITGSKGASALLFYPGPVRPAPMTDLATEADL